LTTRLPGAAILATPSAVPIVAKAADPLIPAAKQVRGRVSGRPRTSPVLRNPGALQRALGKENKRFVGSDHRCRLDWPGLPLAAVLWPATIRLCVPAEPGDLCRVIDPDQPVPDALS
jgi:hypothetical protein